MSEQEKERHAKSNDESTDEPDVEAHRHFGRDDAFEERELQDTADERHRLDEAL